MAAYKNQHFVPRCYLRPFSLDRKGLAINLYNIDRQSSFRHISTKGQCAGSYFYGEDLVLEKMLQKSESLYSETRIKIEDLSYRLQNGDRLILKHFCLLQYSRTEAAAQRAALVQSEMADIAFGGDAPDDLPTSVKDAVQMMLSTFADTADVIDDLKVVLIRNRTDRSFITSDDPAILTNRWYIQTPVAQRKSFGLGSSGALFFPSDYIKDIVCNL
jgi:Protein of unknown function (DUF4238)